MRIAPIEPDLRHAEIVGRLLFAGGHACHHFSASAPFLAGAAREFFDLLVTDAFCGDAAAEDVIARVREVLPGLPVVVLMTSPRESELVATLQAGADDCLSKPARGPEMLARIDALMRRAGIRRPRNRAREMFGEYAFDTGRSVVTFRGQSVAILETVWSRRRDVKSRTLDTHASRIRTKLELRPEFGYTLVPLYGYGYRLDQIPVEKPDGAVRPRPMKDSWKRYNIGPNHSPNTSPCKAVASPCNS
jgi:two-component system OmpR family response regulator